MITYRASLDVPHDTLTTVCRWLREHRRIHDRRPWQRAASVRTQAVLVLRWYKERTDPWILAIDAGVSIATAYRYLHEAIDVIAAQAPDLLKVLERAHREGWNHVCLDGTLTPIDRCSAKNPDTGYDLWYSGKHKQHGGNVQVLGGPDGYPEWVSPAEPGSTHDTAAVPSSSSTTTRNPVTPGEKDPNMFRRSYARPSGRRVPPGPPGREVWPTGLVTIRGLSPGGGICGVDKAVNRPHARAQLINILAARDYGAQ